MNNTLSEKLSAGKKHEVFITSAPKGLEKEFNDLFTPQAVEFLADLANNFDERIDQLYYARLIKKYELRRSANVPKFLETNVVNEEWKIAAVGRRVQNRRLDLGDVSPSSLEHFSKALNCDVQGIQVDFDDGHCPTWRNQITGLHNVYKAARNQLPNVPPINKAPILMLRPRAWNMIEHNLRIDGKEVPGALVDFGLLIFHNGKILHECDGGPYFYLSKLEGASEAKLWNDIFTWTQLRLGIPYGTIKACVLIENILSAFEMEQILYNLKDHSLGLNCGIWDYAASIINKFGNDKSFILPDRNKYVNMNRHFLKRYMELVVKISHKRGAHATGGMAALLLPQRNNDSVEFNEVVKKVVDGKLAEINMGVDGFMVYDVDLVPYMNDLWKNNGGPIPNQIYYPGVKNKITESDLLKLPKGGVTIDGLKHNICVSILFIFHWLKGVGNFPFKGAVEDSATAEISRSQIWQWIRHAASFEGNGEIVTSKLVDNYVSEILYHNLLNKYAENEADKVNLFTACDLFTNIVNSRELPDFITTYLNDSNVFRKLHSNL